MLVIGKKNRQENKNNKTHFYFGSQTKKNIGFGPIDLYNLNALCRLNFLLIARISLCKTIQKSNYSKAFNISVCQNHKSVTLLILVLKYIYSVQ